MSSADEFEFAEFSEEDLRAIDSVADAAFATIDVTWPQSSSNPGLTTNLENDVEESLPPRSRKSSGFSVFDLTEEELRLIDESVARLGSDNGVELTSEAEPDNVLPSESTHPPPPHVDIASESPVASTLAPSPAPTLGRTPTPTHTPTPSVIDSLYAKFRLYRNSLSVSDLVGPSWCEVQFDYGLRGGRGLPVEQRPKVFTSRTGKSIAVRKEIAVENDAVMKKGTAVHKKLEREIRPIEVVVTATTREDRWGLKMINMLSNIRILIDEGRCREMPVMGFVHDHFVSGVIDEIIRTPVTPPSPSFPGGFPPPNEPSPLSPSNTVHIIDNKTRAVPSIPQTPDTLPSRLQLMLYKCLLDALLQPSAASSTGFSFAEIWAHHDIDPCAHFSTKFLEESAILVFSNGLGLEALQARCLSDLESAWETIVQELDAVEGVSKTLKLVYRLRGGEGANTFRKRSAKSSGSSSDTSETRSRPSSGGGTKKARAQSEEVDEDLQRAIHASLMGSSGAGSQSISDSKDEGASGLGAISMEVQEGAAEVMREKKDETGFVGRSERVGLAPGAWVSSDDDDIQRAIRDSIKSYRDEIGIEVSPSPSPPPPNLRDPRRKRESDEGIIGTVEFEHDEAFLEDHLCDVLDFWHNRRPPRGVAIEDTRRCSYCEFADSCEWLETKAAELTPRPRPPRETW